MCESRSTDVDDHEKILHQFRRIAEKVLNSAGCFITEAELDGEIVELLESGKAKVIQNQHKWRFLSKVYGILTAQWLLTTIVSSITIFCSPIHILLAVKWIKASLLIVTPCLCLILLIFLYRHRKQFGLNFILLGLLSLSFSIGIGVSSAHINGKAVAFLYFLGYTFRASIKGKEINLHTPWGISSFCIFILTGIVQIFFPYAFAGGFCVIISNVLISYGVECLMENLDYDDYVWASVKIPVHIFKLLCCCCRIIN
ncbi:BI1-like protein [Quillaja saponaria]|uniref:BI1-like protein n=1 Tax=Quillaja saponaria TaxID=32244 RepID=A0AAD7LBD0_QUISA|nr:BI1-like protein [Quillaja saponaria]